MTKHEIEIPDLPDGWRAVAYRIALRGVDYVLRNGKVTIYNGFSDNENLLIVKKIKPRRVVLEETSEFRQVDYGEYYFSPTHNSVRLWVEMHKSSNELKIWRVVEEE